MKITVELPAETAEQLEQLARARDVSITACALALLEEALDTSDEPLGGVFQGGAEAVDYWKRHGVGESWSRRDDLDGVFGPLEPAGTLPVSATSK